MGVLWNGERGGNGTKGAREDERHGRILHMFPPSAPWLSTCSRGGEGTTCTDDISCDTGILHRSKLALHG